MKKFKQIKMMIVISILLCPLTLSAVAKFFDIMNQSSYSIHIFPRAVGGLGYSDITIDSQQQEQTKQVGEAGVYTFYLQHENGLVFGKEFLRLNTSGSNVDPPTPLSTRDDIRVILRDDDWLKTQGLLLDLQPISDTSGRVLRCKLTLTDCSKSP